MAVFAQELSERRQTVAFVDFKPSVIEVCVNVNANLRAYFRDDLEQIVGGTED